MTAAQTAPAIVKSTFLGDLAPAPGSELFLPAGIAGFEQEHSLLPTEIPAHRPLVFLQSTTNPDTCFVCLPVSSVVSDFAIDVSEEDRLVLGLEADSVLVLGEDILCLALLLPAPGSVRTNLDAPLVINLRNYRCVQVVGVPRNGLRQLSETGTWDRTC